MFLFAVVYHVNVPKGKPTSQADTQTQNFAIFMHYHFKTP
jgi:hypothetical protein